jgi:hypothetical protein
LRRHYERACSHDPAIYVDRHIWVVTSPNWVEWKIPLSSFAGVKATAVKKMYIGVGDRDKPAKGGAGTIFLDDIRVTKAQ